MLLYCLTYISHLRVRSYFQRPVRGPLFLSPRRVASEDGILDPHSRVAREAAIDDAGRIRLKRPAVAGNAANTAVLMLLRFISKAPFAFGRCQSTATVLNSAATA